jgi:(R,R)-butanediol dehydrogenase/meso-butanediol dehydrogenase/diacetyl reductase
MAELVVAPEKTLARVPGGVSLDAAGLAQPMAVGLHAARRAGIGRGDKIVLIGAGAIGSFLLVGLQTLAEADISVIDFPGARLERALRLGAARVFQAQADVADVRLELGGPADVVIEASGAPGQLDKAVSLVRRGGTVLQVGLPGTPQKVNIHPVVMQEISILTTLAHVCDEDLVPALEILHTTDVAEELLDSVHPLDDVPDQLERLAAGDLEGKVLFDPALTR